jgi:excisionase family DNA binding protein
MNKTPPSQSANHERPLLTVSEAATFLSISISTLYGWVWQRRIAFIKVGRAVRFHKADLEQFIKDSRVDVQG